MRAAIFEGPRRVTVKDVPKPVPSTNEVLVEFRGGSICGTDLHLYRGEWNFMKPSQIMGHDAWGIRTDTDQRVAMVPIISCGSCYYCIRGMPHFCEKGRTKGFDEDGLFSDFVAMPSQNLVAIPNGLEDEQAAVVEPVALALHTFGLLMPKVGEWAVILGQGAVGLLMTQVAKLRGCRVIGVDLHEHRLKLSREYGADIIINASEEDPVSKVKEITRIGSDIVVEAAGTSKTVEQTPSLVRNAGRVALIGEFEGRLDLGLAGEARFFAGYLSPNEYPLALDLLARKALDVKALITHTFSLKDFEAAIATANDLTKKPVKVAIVA